jgi:hypothetical protein
MRRLHSLDNIYNIYVAIMSIILYDFPVFEQDIRKSANNINNL